MPDVDGIELLRHVREDMALSSMPVVSVSLTHLLLNPPLPPLNCCDSVHEQENAVCGSTTLLTQFKTIPLILASLLLQ